MITRETYKTTLCSLMRGIAGHFLREPPEDEYRSSLEHLRSVIDRALNGGEDEPPKMPERKTVYEVHYSYDGRDWVHHPVKFATAAEARVCAYENARVMRWQRICAIETSYALIEWQDR